MTDVLSLALPFFGLVLLGFGAGRTRLIGAVGLAGLETYVIYIAMPALFFQFVARTPIDVLSNWTFLVVTIFATYCAFAIAFSLGALINRGNIAEATIEGLVGCHANIGYVAPGLVLASFGAAAAAPMALIFTFHTALVLTLVPVMMAIGGYEILGPQEAVNRTARRIALHPLVLATVIGFIASAIGAQLPRPVDSFLTLLRQSAAPMALFTLGLSLAQMPGNRVTPEMPAMLAIKLIIHPLIVYLLLSWIGGFEPIWVYVAVVTAALPPASNLVEIARSYGVYGPQGGSAVLYGTAASAITIVLLLYLIRAGTLPADLFR